MRVNRPDPTPKLYTHEGARATATTVHNQLQRSVLSCFLWEDTFYEDGVDIATRIKTLTARCQPAFVHDLARKARKEYNLRHAPLMLALGLLEAGKTDPTMREGLSELIADICQRADEPGELLALYWQGKKRPISNQLKKGLKDAFECFNHYSIAKYANREAKVTLRDVMFLVHPTPTVELAATYKMLANGELKAPENTWEVALTSCHTDAEKRAAWENLLDTHSLGALALIRNLRNMEKVGVSTRKIREAINQMDTSRVLPFRFITASRHSSSVARELEDAMFRACASLPKTDGDTIFLIDVSGSMEHHLSLKTEVTCMDAAGALAAVGIELYPDSKVYTFSNSAKPVPYARGFQLMKNINDNDMHGGTNLGHAVSQMPKTGRLIVVTDEQSFDRPNWNRVGPTYCINVSSHRNGISYHPNVVHLDGFSDAVLRWIVEYEKM